MWTGIDIVIFIVLMGIIGNTLGKERISTKAVVIIIVATAIIHLSAVVFTKMSLK